MTLNEVIKFYWRKKYWIILITLFFSSLSYFIGLSIQDKYRANAVLSPSPEFSGPSGVSGSLSGIASLAGLNVGSSAGNDVSKTLAILISRSFLESVITKHGMTIELIANKQKGLFSKERSIDSEIFDSVMQEWRGDYKDPSYRNWFAFEALKSCIQLNQDRKSGLIEISLEWFDRQLAFEWLGILITEINDFVKQADIQEARKSLRYLKDELENVEKSGLENTFYGLIESQMKTIMLANVRDYYALEVVDPPQIPIKKEKSRGRVVLILGTSFGFLFSLLFLFFLGQLLGKLTDESNHSSSWTR